MALGSRQHNGTYERLLIERPILLLMLDVGKPWLDAALVSEQILFVNGILTRLRINNVSLILGQSRAEILTMR
jgi:hypothetical protein